MLVYMGSKRKLAKKIIDIIIQENPKSLYFYDLFGGGGSISIEALKRYHFKKVIYNDINTGIVELLRKIQNEGVTNDFYDWVDRDTFNKFKFGNDWRAGLIKTCWSFSANQMDYLYNKNIENIIKDITLYILNNGYLKKKDIQTRNKLINEYIEINKLKNKYNTEFVVKLNILENINRINKLEKLSKLEQFKELEILNYDYKNIYIDTPINETVIYCDIPYKNTIKYQYDINHNEFLEWCKNSKYKIYVSSYDLPLIEVASWEHKKTLSPTNNKLTIEKLFCNKELLYEF